MNRSACLSTDSVGPALSEAGVTLTSVEQISTVIADWQKRQAVDRVTVSTGFAQLDDVARPFEAGQLWAVIGHGDAGKSTLAVQWATSLATQGLATVILSLVERPELLAEMALSRLSGVPRHRLCGPRSSPEDHDRIDRAVREIKGSELLVEHQPGLSLAVLNERYTRAVRVLVIDDADILGEADEVLTLLRAWCDERGYVVVATFPRSAILRSGADGHERFSVTWSRTVDVTVEVSHPQHTTPGADDAETTLRVLTNRWGPRTDIPLAWQPVCARLLEL